MICGRCGELFFDESLVLSPDIVCKSCEEELAKEHGLINYNE